MNMGKENALNYNVALVAHVLATNSNPNGDRDANGQPRVEVTTGRGEMTDVCYKRGIREALVKIYPEYKLLIDQTNALNNKFAAAADKCGLTQDGLISTMKKDREAFLPVLQYLLEEYIDLRLFGGVLAKLNRAVKGPVQFAIAQSVLPVQVKTYGLTRKAVAGEAEFSERGNSTVFGEKSVVEHGLYIVNGEISAEQAAQTGLTEQDKDALYEAMVHMYDFNKSASRPDMRLCCLYAFEYPEGVVPIIPTWKLWDAVQVTPISEVQDGQRPARAYSDYIVTLNMEGIPDSIKVRKLV